MYIADQNSSIPMNFINQSVGIYLWDSPFSHSLYQGMTDQVLWWWSNLLRFQSTSFTAILSIKCEKRRKIFLCINLTVTFSQKKRKDPFSFSSSYVFYECRQSCTCTQKKKTCFQAKIIGKNMQSCATCSSKMAHIRSRLNLAGFSERSLRGFLLMTTPHLMSTMGPLSQLKKGP